MTKQPPVPMDVLAVDFETFWGPGFSLSTMPTANYIADARFRAFGAAVLHARWDGTRHTPSQPVWVEADKLQLIFDMVRWDKTAFLAHNTKFDGAISAWRYHVRPAMWLDTLSMARATIHPYTNSSALKTVADYLKIGVKDKAAVDITYGRTFDQLSPDEKTRFLAYAGGDVELCWKAFEKLLPHFPAEELAVIDETMRWFIEPRIMLDANEIAAHLWSVRSNKQALYDRLQITPDKVRSQEQFANLLRELGIDPPMKTGLNGRHGYAFAKTDPDFQELLEHPDPDVQALCAARIAARSTLEETRSERLLKLAQTTIPGQNAAVLPVPLRYYGAHTGRFSGEDSINLQNLTRTSPLRKAMKAPPGYVFVVADASQIEARITAWLAGQTDLLEVFRQYDQGTGVDPYCDFATTVFGRPITKKDPRERHMGKTAVLGLGFGMGPEKYRLTLQRDKNNAIKISAEEATTVVQTYRNRKYRQIPLLWKRAEKLLRDAHNLVRSQLGPVETCPDGLLLPNGMRLLYNELVPFNAGYRYFRGKQPIDLWGGKITENIVQALARILTFQAMLRLRHLWYRQTGWDRDDVAFVLTCHDELAALAREELAPQVQADMVREMSYAPDWAIGLPLAAECKIGPSYGEAK